MNDFTKEELIWLEEELNFSFQEHQQPAIAYKIHEKIQSMIENYCDHDFRTSNEVHFKCIHCGNREK